ncbi:MAG: hypothetical protein K2N64_07355 [Anaeroplasmataceae bacterium]|nr:hypothetical protein [Anaeroplasmataceae bacterium]
MPAKEKKETGNEQLLEEILAKINKLKESEKALEKKWSDSVLESKKTSASKTTSLEEEEKQRRVAILIESLKKTSKEKIILEEIEDDELEEFDNLDFEPVDDDEEVKIVPVIEQESYELSSPEEMPSETHILEEEASKDETSTINLKMDNPVDSPLDSAEPALEVKNSEIDETPLDTESRSLDSKEEFVYNEPQQISHEPKEEIELKNESYDPEFAPEEEPTLQAQEEQGIALSEETALEEVKEEHLEINDKEPLLLLTEPNPENYKKEDELLLEHNPYFKNKKILSKRKQIFISILSIVLFIGACISIFAILKALR